MSAHADLHAVSLRPMREADLGAVMKVELAAYPFPWTDGIFRDCLRVGYCCWVVEDPTGIVGYAVLAAGPGEAHLLNLCVAPWRQGAGLGRRLLDHMVALAREHRADSMFLEVRPSNVHALALYRDAGFVEVGHRRDYYPAGAGRREDAVVLAKNL
jgi:[ribosomal protein S18]-alanine N-acetyltransferase